MNKSKFLKKSLAMILAVMLVVAMIPLGASANELLVIDGTIKSLATDKGTLDGESPAWTNALKYSDEGDVTLTVTLNDNSKYAVVNSTVTGADGKAVTADPVDVDGSFKAELKVDSDAKKVTFYAATEDGKTKSTTYTVTFSKPAKSGSVAIASAKTDDGIEATVDNSKKTINLVVPWGYTEEKATATLNIVLENPVSDAPVTKTITIGEDDDVVLTAQNGDTDFYTITSSEMDLPLTRLSVGGVEAVYDKDNDAYVVNMPEGTKLGEMALVFRVSTVNGVSLADAKWNDEAVISGQKPEVKAANKLLLNSNKGTSKTLDVNVVVALSADNSITSFTATAEAPDVNDEVQTYTEEGTVSGQKLTVQLPHKSDLAHTTIAITPAAKATVVKVGGVVATPDEDRVVFTATPVDLSDGKQALVEVMAENGEYAYYRLTATAADKYNDSPAVTGAVLTLGENEVSGTVAGYSVSFTVPYSTTVDDVKNWDNYSWTKTSATRITKYVFAEDPFTGTNTITVTSDGGITLTWSLKFTKEAAKTGKTLESLAYSTATNSDDVKDDNTFKATVSGSKVTVTFPYSYEAADHELVTCYEIPEGAVFAYSANGTLVPYASGYDEETKGALESDNLPAVSDLADENLKIVVLDETAAVALRDELVADLEDLQGDEYKNHVTVYEVDVKFEAAASGHTLNGLATADGLVTSVVSGKTVTMTVPASYVDGAPFFAVYDASKYAVVEAGPVVLPLTAPADKETGDGLMKVVSNGSDLEVQVCKNGTFTTFTDILVTSESGKGSTNYTITVKAAAAQSGARVTSLKVNGYAGVINGREISVTLPFNSDLEAATVEYEVSLMATHTWSLEGKGVADPDDPTIKYYDVSKPFTITVTSEDHSTTLVYTVTVTARTQFTDVPAGSYYYDRVYQAAAAGIVNGYPDGTFKPNNAISRRDFAVMVVKMLGVDTSSYTTTSFTDVAANDYALDKIAFCAENNIISGRGNGIFDPNANITRQEAASIVARALKLTRSSSSTSFKDDAKISSWAKSSVAACAKAGIINGRTDGTFAPTENIKRCDAAIIMVLSLNK